MVEEGGNDISKIYDQLGDLFKNIPPEQQVAAITRLIKSLPDGGVRSLQAIIGTELSDRQKAAAAAAASSAPAVVKENNSPDTLRAIDQSVDARFFSTKLAGRVIFHGKEVLPEGYNEDHGKDYAWISMAKDNTQSVVMGSKFYEQFDPTTQLDALNALVRNAAYNPRLTPIEEALIGSHILAYYRDPKTPDQTRMTLIYPNEFYDRAKRPALTMQLCFNLPSTQFDVLLNMVKASPDSAEDFYQIAASGLDQSVSRVKSGKLAIVDLRTFMPVDKFTNRGSGIHQSVCAQKWLLNQEGLATLSYSRPQGKVEARVQ